jgi:hypothetical protein
MGRHLSAEQLDDSCEPPGLDDPESFGYLDQWAAELGESLADNRPDTAIPAAQHDEERLMAHGFVVLDVKALVFGDVICCCEDQDESKYPDVIPMPCMVITSITYRDRRRLTLRSIATDRYFTKMVAYVGEWFVMKRDAVDAIIRHNAAPVLLSLSERAASMRVGDEVLFKLSNGTSRRGVVEELTEPRSETVRVLLLEPRSGHVIVNVGQIDECKAAPLNVAYRWIDHDISF